MPVSPLVPAYDDLRARQAALGLRHAADGLFPVGGRPAVRFLVLDGLRVPGRGGRPRHVDRDRLAEIRAASTGPAAWDALLTRYDAVLAEDPMGLRRIVLYELLRLLRDDPQGPRPEAAVALGVDPAEATALAYAARHAPRLEPAARTAAETLPDAWRERRVRHARALTRQLPTPLGDQRLARLVARVEARARHVDDLLKEADALKRAGDAPAAAQRYLRAARAAEDDPHALRGLILTCRPDGALAAEPGPEGVRLNWRPDARAWRVLRYVAGQAPVTLGEATGTSTGTSTFTDTAAPLGERVRHAVLPLGEGDGDDGRIAGLPLVGPELLVAPEVEDVQASDARARVDATWRTPPGAHRVTVVRTGPRPETTATEIAASPHGFRDDGLAPGTYEYRISCVYRTAAGREVRSPGLRLRRTVHPWPDAVTALTVRPGDTPGTLTVGWTGGDRGDVRLLVWPGPPPQAGEDLPATAGRLPSALPWLTVGSAGLRPPRGTTARLTAVTVLGERAVAGPSVRVDVPEAVEALTVRRVGPGRARLTFDWPGAADRVLVRWWQDGRADERRIGRSTYFREGLHIDVTGSAARFQAEPLAVTDADVLLPPPPAEAEIPADVAVSYTVERLGGRFAGRRRRVAVRAEVVGEAAPGLPELLLVARTAAEPLPRTPEDGTPVLRLSGGELTGGPVSRDVQAAVEAAGIRRPYTLRAFLLGPHAHAVRLEEPPHKDLVVR
ncbi:MULTISPECIES: hypothetical protein [Streptomyces]|uniref:SaeA second Fn3-like domain-containing protein n=1 Tax=Streptomyces ehimensis TaxID=68195 RepID=A0ABV9BCX8_9ACTN